MGKGGIACCKAQVEPEGGFKEHHSTTDILWFLLWIVMVIVMIVVTVIAVGSGNPHSLIMGKDYNQNLCGRPCESGDGFDACESAKIAEKPLLVWPQLDADYRRLVVEEGGTALDLQNAADKLTGICVKSCPAKGDTITNPYDSSETWVERYKTFAFMNRCFEERYEVLAETTYCEQPTCIEAEKTCVNTNGYVNAWVYDEGTCDLSTQFKTVKEPAESNPLYDQVFEKVQMAQSFVGDVYKGLTTICLCGILEAAVLIFVYVLLLRLFAGVIVWCCLIGFVLFMFLATLLAAIKAGMLESEAATGAMATASAASGMESAVTSDESTQGRWKAMTLIMMLLTLITIIILIWCRKQVKICVALLKEAGKCIGSYMSLMLFPFSTLAFLIGMSLFFLYILAFLYTAETINTTTLASIPGVNDTMAIANATSLEYGSPDTTIQYLMAVHLFGYLWTCQFFIAIGTMVIARVGQHWYFTQLEPEGREKMALLNSVKIMCRYHLGTAALGSLIIAIVQFVRIVLEYIDNQTKTAQDKNFMLKMAMKCIKCCMWCLEKCLKFITGYAFIYTAVKGVNFCSACKKTFGMIMSYPKQVGVNGLVQNVLWIVQQIAIPMVCCITAYILFENRGPDEEPISNSIIPIVVTGMFAYIICGAMGDCYTTTVNTLLVCSLMDKDEFGCKYMSDSLKNAYGEEGKDTKQAE